MSLHIRNGDTPAYTQKLAAFLSSITYEQLPEAVVAAARRGVLDWLGCAFAASHHSTLDLLLQVLRENDGAPQARVFGRGLSLSRQDAALANGQMGHLLDFDDTHMGGVILHASSPILAALFAAVDGRPAAGPGGSAASPPAAAPADSSAFSGREFIAAYVAGFEAGVRIGQAAPEHHAGGWHLTGTLGTFAAAAGCGRLMRLTPQQMTHALGIAGTQAAGMQQNRGTMCKSFHAGKAASSGLLAARLAAKGFDSSEEIVEGRRGFARIYSKSAAPEKLVDRLGEDWMIATNGHKPYACGVVQHPAIDAMIDLRQQLGGTVQGVDGVDGVDGVEVFVHPGVITITGAVRPTTGLHAKFSIYHSVAVALVDGAAGIAQYSNERAADPAVLALADRITIRGDESLRSDEARAVLTCGNERFAAHVAHASGTAANPMSDAAIEAKFMANALPVLGEEKAQRLAVQVWKLGATRNGPQDEVAQLLGLCG
jgi:2-methylcitrate dehydratase PrpD